MSKPKGHKPQGIKRNLRILSYELARISKQHSLAVPAPISNPETADLVAYRFARLLYHKDRPYFRSMVVKVVFDTISDAICKKQGSSHQGSPHPSCRCGFYGVMEPTEIPLRLRVADTPEATLIIQQVKLSGLVIPGEQGYRAERQDVVQVWLYHTCYLCDKPAAAMVPSNYEGNFGLLEDDQSMLPACKLHMTAMYHTYPAYSLADLSGVFGTDFAWMERPMIQQP